MCPVKGRGPLTLEIARLGCALQRLKGEEWRLPVRKGLEGTLPFSVVKAARVGEEYIRVAETALRQAGIRAQIVDLTRRTSASWMFCCSMDGTRPRAPCVHRKRKPFMRAFRCAHYPVKSDPTHTEGVRCAGFTRHKKDRPGFSAKTTNIPRTNCARFHYAYAVVAPQ